MTGQYGKQYSGNLIYLISLIIVYLSASIGWSNDKAGESAQANMAILSISPTPNANHVALDANIEITFDQNIDGTTLDNSTVILNGRQSGRLSAVYSGGGTTVITIDPDNNFRLGEVISVTITTGLTSDNALNLARGHTYSFTAISGAPPTPDPVLAQRVVSGSFNGEDVRVLDVDSDGDPDIITGSEGIPEQLVFFENDGEMGFCGYSTGGNFRHVQVFDIDGDGDYDNFGQTGSFDTELNWFENEGTPPFTEHLVSFEDPWTIAGGDLDSDGDIDVVAPVILPDRVLWFSNDGDGNFSGAIPITSNFNGGSDSHFYIRDINSDGAMDILAFHQNAFDLVWYENNGSQGFTQILIDNHSDRAWLTSGDIDDDGDIDIVAASIEFAPTVALAWYENDGNENFTEHAVPVTYSGNMETVQITDLDGDLDMDILAGSYWFENDGSQNFTQIVISEGLSAGDSYFTRAVDYADMDEDGDMDIVTMTFLMLHWQENSQFMTVTATDPPNATFDAAQTGDISITFDQPVDMATVNSMTIRVISQLSGLLSGDFSSDGANTVTFDPSEVLLPGDIVEVSITEKVLSLSGHSLAITHGFSFRVRPSEVDQPDFLPHSLFTHSGSATGIDIADMDGDGDADILSCSFTELYWHENDGSGNFTAISLPVTDAPARVFALDENDDGYMDILVDNSGNEVNTLYINDGNQGFSDTTFFGIGTLSQMTDLNHDGDTDIIFLSWNTEYVGYSDKRCGLYASLGSIPDITSRGVVAADMDNDGDTDFIAASTLGPDYYENDGFLNFAQSDIDAIATVDQYLADIDGDGDIDPIFAESFSAITWYENRLTEATQDFGGRQEIAPLNMDPRDVIAVDIDGDGDPDIAAISRNDDKVVWYENRLDEATADFGPEQLGVSDSDSPIKLLSGDLNGDGAMDLIVISNTDEELIWYENTGTVMTGIEDEMVSTLPQTYSLHQNYPNPFNPGSTIQYELPQSARVTLKIYTVLGQEVTTLVDQPQPSGRHEVSWDGRNHSGQEVVSGVYIYRLKSKLGAISRKMMLLR